MKLIILFISLFILNGCGIGQDDPALYPAGVSNTPSSNEPRHDCTDAINALIAEKGKPEEIQTYDTNDNYHSHNYWYWSKGYNKGFKWGEYFDGCETSVYTFDPIG